MLTIQPLSEKLIWVAGQKNKYRWENGSSICEEMISCLSAPSLAYEVASAWRFPQLYQKAISLAQSNLLWSSTGGELPTGLSRMTIDSKLSWINMNQERDLNAAFFFYPQKIMSLTTGQWDKLAE